MNKEEFKDQLRNAQALLVKEIDEMIDKKVVSLNSRFPSQKVDKESIKKQCEEALGQEIRKNLVESCDENILFFEQLKIDNPELEKSIRNTLKEKAPTSEKIQSIDDLAKFSDAIPSQQEIQALNDMGMNYFNNENWSKACLYFTFLSHVEMNNPVSWVLRGMSEHNIGQYDKALHSYATALTFAPQYVFAHVQLMKSLMASNQMSLAQKYYDEFLHRIDPQTYANDIFFTEQLEIIKSGLHIQAA